MVHTMVRPSVATEWFEITDGTSLRMHPGFRMLEQTVSCHVYWGASGRGAKSASLPDRSWDTVIVEPP